ncbi:MAG TPA: hypothetical protein DCG49_01575 [Ruminococcus sp.]|nr:hypothetical protein [Ruminococcus sp.]
MRIEDERPYEDKKRTDKPFILRFVYICRIMSNIIHNYQFLYNVNIIFIFHLINVHEKKMPYNHRTVQHLSLSRNFR